VQQHKALSGDTAGDENLVNYPQEYKYSSVLFYEEGIDIFGLVTHYDDE